MNFNTNKTESNNKFNSINFAKKRGRPKKDEGIAKPSTKKEEDLEKIQLNHLNQ